MDRLRVAVADAGASAPAGSSVPAGTAYFTVRRGLLSTSFRYDDSYLASAGAYPIDPGWPLLDGGHIVLNLWEGVARRPAPPRLVNALANAFAVLFIALFLALTFRDSVRHLAPPVRRWWRGPEAASSAPAAEPAPAGASKSGPAADPAMP